MSPGLHKHELHAEQDARACRRDGSCAKRLHRRRAETCRRGGNRPVEMGRRGVDAQAESSDVLSGRHYLL
eukprot:gene2131-6791_t